MRLLFLSLLLSFPAPAAERSECASLRPKQPPVGNYPRKTRMDGFEYVQECARGNNWQKVENSAAMKHFLKGVSVHEGGELIPVYSCFRPQESQDYILCNNQCAPRFGTRECSGRIAANKSEHTVGVAADFKIQTQLPKNPTNAQQITGIKQYCKALDEIRKRFAGGRGGITIYGISPEAVAMGHYDTKPDWCNWGKHCEDTLGEGHCKRKKYEEKEARLMEALNAARILQKREEIARLERELARLRADCKPGDLSCRDSFKD